MPVCQTCRPLCRLCLDQITSLAVYPPPAPPQGQAVRRNALGRMQTPQASKQSYKTRRSCSSVALAPSSSWGGSKQTPTDTLTAHCLQLSPLQLAPRPTLTDASVQLGFTGLQVPSYVLSSAYRGTDPAKNTIGQGHLWEEAEVTSQAGFRPHSETLSHSKYHRICPHRRVRDLRVPQVGQGWFPRLGEAVS